MAAAHEILRPTVEAIFSKQESELLILVDLKAYYPEIMNNQGDFASQALVEAAKYGHYEVAKFLINECTKERTFSPAQIHAALKSFAEEALPQNASHLENLFDLLLTKTTIEAYDAQKDPSGGFYQI